MKKAEMSSSPKGLSKFRFASQNSLFQVSHEIGIWGTGGGGCLGLVALSPSLGPVCRSYPPLGHIAILNDRFIVEVHMCLLYIAG